MDRYRNCSECNKEFYVRADRVKTGRFCSRKCQMPWLSQRAVIKMKEKWSNEDFNLKIKESFDRFAIKKDGCWDWDGCKANGYGVFRLRGKHYKAHRASWVIANGDIPKGIFVLHKCDNPPCSNPEHLFLGTAVDNSRDKLRKNRRTGGEKLSEEQVKEIRNLLKMGVTGVRIQKDYSISETTVTNIKLNRTWKDIN